jgi:uncharacterized protein (TIGR02145 family)
MNKVKITLLTAGFVLAMAFTFSCSSDGGDGGGSVDYKGQTYKTVKIGVQTWFAENLNYAVTGSKCYGEGGYVISWDEDNNSITKTLSPAEVQANCDKYGRLYDWSTAMALPSSCNESSCSNRIQSKHRGICPAGWHIPSNNDWDVLMDYVGGYETSSGIENLDTHGFRPLLGGGGQLDGSFCCVGSVGFWWSASVFNSDVAYVYGVYGGARRDDLDKSRLQSVRCLQD